MGLGRLYFLEAGQIALLSGDPWLEALANNNLAVVSWSEGDEERGNAEADRVIRAVTTIAEQAPPESVLLELVELARARSRSLRPLPASLDEGRQLPLLDREPRCCGTLNVLLRNLSTLGKIVKLDSLSAPWVTRRKVVESGLAVLQYEKHPLVVHSYGSSLVLAIE